MKFALLFIAALLLAETEVTCPEHGYAKCRNTHEAKYARDGHILHKYHCTCGDDWWVRD